MAVSRTDEQWRSLFADFDRSGLTIRAFCKEQGVSVSHFHGKRRQLREQAFTPVQVAAPPHNATAVPVLLEAGNVTITSTTEAPPAWLADLVKALHH